jgi:hypothetical protein
MRCSIVTFTVAVALSVCAMLTVFEHDDKIFNAIRAGADGHFLKRTPLKELLEGIVEAMEGGAPMSPAMARKVLESSKQQPTPSGSRSGGTGREEQVRTDGSRTRDPLLAGEGPQLHDERGGADMSISTVNTPVNRVYNKLQVNSATEEVGWRCGGALCDRATPVVVDGFEHRSCGSDR